MNLHPGKLLLKRGYFGVAGDNGIGDQYFISAHEGENPALYRIGHETDEDADTILAVERQIVAPSLSEFFKAALVEAETFS